MLELETRLLAYAGKSIDVLVRTASEMQAVLNAKPFHGAAPNHTVAIFLEATPSPADLVEATG